MKRGDQRTLGRSRSGRDANSREYSLRQTVMWNDSVTTNGVEMECRCNGCNDDSTRNAYLMPISPLTLSAPQAPESNAPLVASNARTQCVAVGILTNLSGRFLARLNTGATKNTGAVKP